MTVKLSSKLFLKNSIYDLKREWILVRCFWKERWINVCGIASPHYNMSNSFRFWRRCCLFSLIKCNHSALFICANKLKSITDLAEKVSTALYDINNSLILAWLYYKYLTLLLLFRVSLQQYYWLDYIIIFMLHLYCELCDSKVLY